MTLGDGPVYSTVIHACMSVEHAVILLPVDFLKHILFGTCR